MISRARTRLRERAQTVRRDQRGIAIAVTMLVITIGFALASVGAITAIGSLRSSSNDQSDKGAFGIAEAGLQQALVRQNKVVAEEPFPCLVLNTSSELVASGRSADGWCQAQTGEINGGTYRYRVQPTVSEVEGESVETLTIVSEGTLGGETRRVSLDASAATGEPAFGTGQIIGLERLDLGGSGSVFGSLQTNGDLNVTGSATCDGDVSVGNGKNVNPDDSVCGGQVIAGSTALGPVDQGDVLTSNSNARLADGRDVMTGNADWDESSRTLRLKSRNDSVTLGGTNYSFCSLEMTGGILYVAEGATVRIYFDAPENCPTLGDPAKQVDMGGNSSLRVTSENPNDLAFLLVGSDEIETVVEMNGKTTTTNYITIYAPRSTVIMRGTADYLGAIAGREVDLSGSGTITGVESTLDFSADVETKYEPARFVECVGPMALSDPDAGC